METSTTRLIMCGTGSIWGKPIKQQILQYYAEYRYQYFQHIPAFTWTWNYYSAYSWDCNNISIWYEQFIHIPLTFVNNFRYINPIYALLASKRRLIDLQKTPFWGLTKALLKANKAPFILLLYNYLILCWLRTCFLYVVLLLFIDILLETM